ncbi:hypothetical protein [Streptacidiphilus cavernicola]|uniref:Uncharacterized protein n=1 Tax=Streptacidiphilus cavernicola TaxID=3342716 RepID=A0ABV6VNZ0_9ACTN
MALSAAQIACSETGCSEADRYYYGMYSQGFLGQGIIEAAGAGGIVGSKALKAQVERIQKQKAESGSATRFGPNPPPGTGDNWTVRASDNGKGTVWQAPGSNGNANSVCVMAATPRYANGYVRFYNSGGQPLGINGNPGPNSATPIPLDQNGNYPLPTGWQQ